MQRSTVRLLIALLAGGLLVAVIVARTDATPVVAGDSLVTEAAGPDGDGLPGVRVVEGVGHDLCQDRDEIERAGRRHPDRIVLAYTGNAHSDRVRRAVDEFGAQGLGLVYAGCLRDIRHEVPDDVALVVVAAPACAAGDDHGSPVLNAYLRAATLGGTYPSGVPVGPMRNATFSTAADDRLTPGHRYRDRDDGGLLRTGDGLHLTAYGARAYAGVLQRIASTPT